jgi:hypothetical protein
MNALERLTRRIPWPASAATVVVTAAVLAIGTQFLVGPYFERSFLDEASPLSAARDANESMPPAVADGSQPPPAATAPATPPNAPGVLFQGEWRDGAPGHNGEGIVKIIRTPEGRLVLRVEEFSVTNGPDLFVVLSPSHDGYADGSLNLGGLKATDGNFNYDIPDGTDLSQFRSAVVWCRGADITFAYATLEEV